MTYESLLNDLRAVYDWFFDSFQLLLTSIKSKPLIILGLFVLISFPVLYLLFDFFGVLAESTDDFTTDGIRIYKYFRSGKFNKKAKEMRLNFHKFKSKFNRNDEETVSKQQLNEAILKWDKVPLKIPENHKKVYSQQVNPSSSSTQRSSANIDVEVDDD